MRIIRTIKVNGQDLRDFRPVLSLITCSLLLMMRTGFADDSSYFNPAFLSSDTASVADLSRFEQGKQLAGTYHVDVSVNDQFVTTKDVKFINTPEGSSAGGLSGGLTPCIDKQWLEALGINTAGIQGLEKYSASECLPIEKLIPASEIDYNFASQKLNLSFPQAWIQNSARGYIPPSQWDEGIPAGLLSYNFSGDNGSYGKNYFLSLNSGINLGAWRLRNTSAWTYSDYAGYRNNNWRNTSTYLERDIIPLRSELVAGDSNTDNSVYDSLGFRGINVYSDDSMYPDSLQGFAPTVRGIANSRAKIIVRQNGYVIYQTFVSPGPFAINDLNPTNSSGDLTVTVQESDGTTHSFIVPYSTVPLLQREGRIKYNLVAGNYRSGDDEQNNPFFTQGTLIAGLSHGTTVYGGTQLSSNYQAFTAGAGKNMGDFGALSVDVTQAQSTLTDGSDHQGQSMRFLYAKSLNRYGTTFQLLGYRYSTRGFYTLADTTYKNIEGYQYSLKDDDNNDGNKIYTATGYHNLNFSKKGRYQINVSQNLGGFGSFYVAASQQTYWNTADSDKTYQLGYANNLGGANFYLSWSSTQTSGLNDADHVVALNVSVPLSVFLGHRELNSDSLASRMYLTANTSRNSDGNNTVQTGVSGTLLKEHNLSYSVMQGHSTASNSSGNASANLQGSYGTAGIGYSYSNDSHDYNVSASGGMVFHQNGITLSQSLGDTNILVKAPGAAGVSLENQTGVATDYRGYTVIPYAEMYRSNRVALNTDTMNNQTDITDNVANVVPTRGALVRASFVTHIGIKALITLTHHGKPVPFGASVEEKNTGLSSIVGDAGQVYLSGLPKTGVLQVQWGDAPDQRCTARYHISEDKKNIPVYMASAVCQ